MDKSNSLLMSGSHGNTADIHICGACKAQFNDVVVFLTHKKQCSEMCMISHPQVPPIRKSNSFDTNSDRGPPCESVQTLEPLVLTRDDTQSSEIACAEGVYRSGEGEMLPLVLSQDVRNQSTIFTQPVNKTTYAGDMGGMHQGQVIDSTSQRSRTVAKQQRSQHRLARMAQDLFRQEDNISQDVETLSVEKNIQHVTSRLSQEIISESLCQTESDIAAQNFQMASSKFSQDRAGTLVPFKDETRVRHVHLNSQQITSRLGEDTQTVLVRGATQLETTDGQTILLRNGAQLSQIRSSGHTILMRDGVQLSEIASSGEQSALIRDGAQLSQIPSSGHTVLMRDGLQLSEISSSGEQSLLIRDGGQLSQIPNSEGQAVLLRDGAQLSQIVSSEGQNVLMRDSSQHSQIQSSGQTVFLREGAQLSQVRSSEGQTLLLRDGAQLSQIPNSGQTVLLREGAQLSQIQTSEGQTVLLREGEQLSQIPTSDGQAVLMRGGVQVSQIPTSEGRPLQMKDVQLSQLVNSDGCTVLIKDGVHLSQLGSSDLDWQHQQQQVLSESRPRVSVDGINVYNNNTEMFSGTETGISFEVQIPNESRSEASNFPSETNVMFHPQESMIEHMQVDSLSDTTISEQALGTSVDLLSQNKGQTVLHQKVSATDSSSSRLTTVGPVRVSLQKSAAGRQKRIKMNDLGILQDTIPSAVYDVPSSTGVQDVAANAGIVSVSAGVHGASFQQVAVNDGIPVIHDVLQTQTGLAKRGLDHVLTVPDPDSPSKKRYKCVVTDCTFSTTYIRDLERHNRVHTGERPFMCPLCPKSFSRSDKLNIHLRGHTGSKPFKCSFCDYGAADSSSLKKHIRIHTDERPFRCQICPYASRNSSQLIVHLRTHTGDSPFQCSVCDAKFKINSDLKRHMRIHTGEKPYGCDLCDYRCSVRGNLKCHYRLNHSNQNQKSCPEQDCDFTTSSRKTLWEHKKTHDLLRPIKCEFCIYQCASNSALRMHMRVHSNDRPFSCNFCIYSSKQSGNLKTHIRKKHPETFQIRSGRSSKRKGKGGQWVADEDPGIPKLRQNCRKAYKCNICSASFVREDSLRSHTRQHCREIEQNLESTALAVLEQQSGAGQQSMSLLPQQNQLTSSLSSISQQISPGLEATDTLNQNISNANSDPFVFIPPQKMGEKSIKFMSTSVPQQSEHLSQQVVFSSPSSVTLNKDSRLTTYRVSEGGCQAIDERMFNVTAVTRSSPHDTVVASAMQSPVMSHSLVSQAQLSSSPKHTHPLLVAAMTDASEVALRLPMISQSLPTSVTQHITYHTDSTTNQISEPLYLTQNKYHTIPSDPSAHDQLANLVQAAQIQIPTSSHHIISTKPVRIVQQAPAETTKLVFADGSSAPDYRVATDSGLVTHQLVQMSQGLQIIQNIPLHSLRLVGKGTAGQMDGEVGSEKVSSSVLPTVMTSLQSDQQLIHPQLVQHVQAGQSEVGHLQTVNLQVIKPTATQASYPVSVITQEVTEQSGISQNAPAIAQFQIVLPSGLQNPQIVRNSVSGQPQIVVQVEEAMSSRVEQSPVSGTQAGMITLPISMAQTLLGQVQPQDSGVVSRNPVSVVQDGVQLQEVIVAVDRSSLIGAAITRGSNLLSGCLPLGYFPFQPVVHNWFIKGHGTEECHSEAK